MKTHDVTTNRGGTAVKRWIHNHKAGVVRVRQQRAVCYTQKRWVRADGNLRAIGPTRGAAEEMVEGMSQQKALDELDRLNGRLPALLGRVRVGEPPRQGGWRGRLQVGK